MMKMKMKKLYKNEYEELLALRKRTELLESALNTVQESLVITNSTGQIIMKNQAAQKSEDKPKLLTSTHSLTHGCTLNVSHQKENEVLSYAFNTLPQIIWMTDGLGVNDYVSTRFKEATGRECLSGDNWHAIIHPDDLPELLRRWQNSVQTGRPFEVECRMLFKDYGYQWVMDRGVPVKNADGQIIRWLGTLTDIETSKQDALKLKEAQKRLAHDRERCKKILDDLPVPIIVARAPAGEIFYYNKELARIWKDPPKDTNEIEDYKNWIAFHPDGRQFESEDWPLARSIQNGEVISNEIIKAQYADGSIGYLRVLCKPLYNQQGEIEAAVSVSQDITEELSNEYLKVQLLSRERAAVESDRLKSEFLANMSHEVRTPLNCVLGMAESLLDDPEFCLEHIREDVRHLKASGKILLVIINDILDESKVESGLLAFELNWFEVAEMMRHIQMLLRPIAIPKAIELEFVMADGFAPKYVRGDLERISQIVLNLGNNAIKFSDQGRVIFQFGRFVEIEHDDQLIEEYLTITIKDSGIGMSEEAKSRLYQPYMQAHPSISRKYGGTGLGLSICKRLIDRMNGRICCESEEGIGTKFTVFLPLEMANNVPTVQQQSTSASSPIFDGSWKGEDEGGNEFEYGRVRVLVVEDNLINQKLIIKVLNKIGVTKVDLAANGQEAIDLLSHQSPLTSNGYDLVFMDCQMPVLDGYEATKKIRTMKRNISGIPIIALTASALKSDQLRCFESGMNDHVAKPYTRSLIEDCIRKWYNHHPPTFT